jgi:hypothetical protein
MAGAPPVTTPRAACGAPKRGPVAHRHRIAASGPTLASTSFSAVPRPRSTSGSTITA